MATSRLVVKGLPKHLNEKRFRDHFSSRGGDVTDVKIVTKDGKSRQFGFVGFRNEEAAKVAKEYFDRTFIDTSRISVDYARAIGDSSIPRPWSKYSEGSSAHARIQKKQEEALKQQEDGEADNAAAKTKEEPPSKIKTLMNDPEFQEFLKVANPSQAAKFWANDDGSVAPRELKGRKGKKDITIAPVASKKPGGEGVFYEKTHIKFDENSSDEEYEDLPALKKDIPALNSGASGGEVDDPMVLEEEQTEKVEKLNQMSDLDFLKSKVVNKAQFEDEQTGAKNDDDDATSDGEHTAESSKAKGDVTKSESDSAKKVEDEVEDVADTGRLFIRNLPQTVTEDDIIALCKPFGDLVEVHVPLDRESKTPKGFAFALFVVPENAVRALNKLNGSIFQGKLIHVIPAKRQPQAPVSDDPQVNNARSAFKKKKLEQLRASSGQEYNWNSLFMRSDAVATAMQEKLKVDKSEILDREADNMAVRLALGETSIIQETKTFLEEEGVDLDVLGRTTTGAKVPRGRDTILVKNLPYETEAEELQEMFGGIGTMTRLVLPPVKTIALIQYAEPGDARKAFRRLAYKNFHHVPMFLEWAPEGLFKEGAALTAERKVKESEEEKKTQEAVNELLAEGEEESSTVFVKNLNFKTTEDKLKDVFLHSIGNVRAVTIAKKKDMKNKGNMLSMGYGFVEFSNRDSALKAIKQFQGYQLDDHPLALKFSSKKVSETSTRKRKETSTANEGNTTKLVVRNVPFQATKKDIRELFSTYGSVKSVRIPSKTTGNHRGFAFVEFMTKNQAKTAFDALRNTHLYGRHLVLEYAEEDGGVEEIRKKTLRQFENAQNVQRDAKRKKFDVDGDKSFDSHFTEE